MDSPQTRKTVLNLPTEMSESTLRLDSLSSSFRGISTLSSPSKTSTCSDRFIPCRLSSRLHQFDLNDKSSPVKDGGNEAYQRLLRSELFGSPAGGGGQVASPLLRFKTEHSRPNSPYSPSRCTCSNLTRILSAAANNPDRVIATTALNAVDSNHYQEPSAAEIAVHHALDVAVVFVIGHWCHSRNRYRRGGDSSGAQSLLHFLLQEEEKKRGAWVL